MFMSILFIIPFFGKTPSWLPYFIQSCAYNPTINWLIYGNLDFSKIRLPDNIIHIRAELDDLNKLIYLKLSVKTKIVYIYKLCDYRPAYFQLFADYIKNYTYWGYCDMDLIFGNIQGFLDYYSLSNFDVITASTNYLSGPFTLFRNKENINQLYRRIWRYYRRINDQSRHYCLDEKVNYIGDLFVEKKFFNKNKILKSLYRITRSVRYRTLKKLPFMQDVSQLVFKMERKGELKVLRLNAHRPDTEYYAKDIVDWKIRWEKGTLTDLTDQKELLYFHFLESKKRKFSIKNYNFGDEFFITTEGISY